MARTALVTGAAGFIGSHVTDRLLAEGWRVVAVDNFDPFYDPEQKRLNIVPHLAHPAYRLVEGDVRDVRALERALDEHIDVVVHLAAKAGVRPSIENPVGYQDVNVMGTQLLLELCRERGIRQFVFGSSSSVYGVNPNVPWSEEDCVLMPISPYASTKVSGELLGHVYSKLFGIRFVALRFFTVYGPRQRPDLAIHRFSRLLREGRPIPIFGDGGTRRDYTFVGDIVEGIVAAMDYTGSLYEVINLGNNRAITLLDLVRSLEEVFDVRATLDFRPDQPGDVPQTWASIDKAAKLLGYAPATSFAEGLDRFAAWLTGPSSADYQPLLPASRPAPFLGAPLSV
jgi:UDP-glucuronate 4-epimerase